MIPFPCRGQELRLALSRLTLPPPSPPPGGASGQTPLLISGCPDDIVIDGWTFLRALLFGAAATAPRTWRCPINWPCFSAQSGDPDSSAGIESCGWGWLSSGPATVVAWHRHGFQLFCNRSPTRAATAPRTPEEVERRLGGMRTATESRCNVVPARVARM
jgi:hypothetical protein